MLSKDICKRCYMQHDVEWTPLREKAWEKFGIVFCMALPKNTGHIDQLRISKGAATWADNFHLPTNSPFDSPCQISPMQGLSTIPNPFQIAEQRLQESSTNGVSHQQMKVIDDPLVECLFVLEHVLKKAQ